MTEKLKGIKITHDILLELGAVADERGGVSFTIAGVNVFMYPRGQSEDPDHWVMSINHFRTHSVTHLDEVIANAWLDGCEWGAILKQNEIKEVLGISLLGGLCL